VTVTPRIGMPARLRFRLRTRVRGARPTAPRETALRETAPLGPGRRAAGCRSTGRAGEGVEGGLRGRRSTAPVGASYPGAAAGTGTARPGAGGRPSRPSPGRCSSEGLRVARRSLLRRGVALVLGAFLLHALAFCLAPGLLSRSVHGGLQVGELVTGAQVLVIGFGVWTHDRAARRYVDPLARRVADRHRDGFGRQPGAAGSATDGGPASVPAARVDAPSASFDAFDRVKAFGGRAPL
jgi:hypothetical protein